MNKPDIEFINHIVEQIEFEMDNDILDDHYRAGLDQAIAIILEEYKKLGDDSWN